jgi:uncharacterized protein YcbX
MLMPAVAALYRYPVKGLSAEPLDTVELRVGQTVPHDRIYAVEHGPRRFDPAAPAWLPKVAFLCLMKDAPLAALSSRYEVDTGVLSLARDGVEIAAGDLGTEAGKAVILTALDGYRGPGRDGDLRLVRSPEHSFSDVPNKVISIVNLASVRALQEVSGVEIDPLRFRANLHLDGLDPWEENSWLDRTLHLPSGAALRIRKTTTRCAATEVRPGTGARDIEMLALLTRATGGLACGVYAEVTAAGRLGLGDELALT